MFARLTVAALLLVGLSTPALAQTENLQMFRAVQRQVLQYQLSGNEVLGRGPLVLLLDKSGSMEGPKDTWATALALALLEHAHAERRPFALIDFNGSVTYETTVEARMHGASINGDPLTGVDREEASRHRRKFLFLAGIGNFFNASFGTRMLTASSTMRTEIAAGACSP